MPYTILILKLMGAQLIINFFGAVITSGMRPSINGARRGFMKALWALTGFALIGAIAWDIFKMLK
ncbi:hypothetical protein NLO72_06620 [Pseudomonas tremae]|uniref:Uncharacterized protein n=1 Tax=Pseudomonas syringae pv. syringae TaxID=321 RepID=A0AB35JQ65_PSESY|nr:MULTISPECIES: hypothetical protein [Pseudomonas syringae group]KGS14159.1 hypothetical protein OA77_12615 [Pseudomonas coronafaciens]MCQ2988915.1 hypothetical protein [Pseudomonas tremae]MCQ3015562.1 hypothetical protein [Pseudomonas tremae]MDC3738198.1 hypothetical protein [Pseudomonas syringae pv. syringae]QGL55929.1 hypothetical protein POR16_06040 [Pseudomonas coronafaciens pv. oryzae str. 1_6]